MLLTFISRNNTTSGVRVFGNIYRWISLSFYLAEGGDGLTRGISVRAPSTAAARARWVQRGLPPALL